MMNCETCKLQLEKETIYLNGNLYHPRCLSDYGVACARCELPVFDLEEVLSGDLKQTVFFCKQCRKESEESRIEALIKEHDEYKEMVQSELTRVRQDMLEKLKVLQESFEKLKTENLELKKRLEQVTIEPKEVSVESPEESKEDLTAANKENVIPAPSRKKKIIVKRDNESMPLGSPVEPYSPLPDDTKENFDDSSSVVSSVSFRSTLDRFKLTRISETVRSDESHLSSSIALNKSQDHHQLKQTKNFKSIVCHVCREKAGTLSPIYACLNCSFKCHKACKGRVNSKCSFNPLLNKPDLVFGGTIQLIVNRDNTMNGIPLVVEKLVNLIEADITKANLYSMDSSGSALKVRYLISMVNDNFDNPRDYLEVFDNLEIGTYALASLLKEFFVMLVEPIVPSEFVKIYKLSPKKRIATLHSAYITKLSPIFKRIIEFIIEHLRRVIKYSDRNGMTLPVVCNIFTEVLTRAEVGDKEIARSMIEYFIQKCPFN
jgi:predicted metal-binding protein